MLTEILKSSSVEQLKGILRSRYGKDLKVSFLMDITSIAVTAQSPPNSGGDLRILIAPQGEFLAEACIENGTALSLEDQDSASMLVKMVLEPAIQNWKRKVEDTSLYTIDSTKFENVFPIWGESPDFQSDSLQTKSLSTNILFLEGQKPFLFEKVALEIHDLSQRWASLRYSDIRSQVSSVKDLHELGTVTVVIEDLTALNLEEQNLIADFIEDANITEDPLLLITSNVSANSLGSNPLIHPRLLPIIKRAVLEVERLPVATSLLRETLELFLEPEAMI
jgi:hypothetical protein